MIDVSNYIVTTPVNEQPLLVCEREMKARRHQYQSKEVRGQGALKALLFRCDECGTVRVWGAE